MKKNASEGIEVRELERRWFSERGLYRKMFFYQDVMFEVLSCGSLKKRGHMIL